MSGSVSTTSNGLVVVTHVYPMGNLDGVTPPRCLGPRISLVLERFRAKHPTALGTIQIMTGLMVLLLGIVMSVTPDNIGLFVFVWESVIYVIAGSLTVAADNYMNQYLVKGSLGMNTAAAVIAVAGFVIHVLDAFGLMINCNYSVVKDRSCPQYLARSQGISGVLALLSLLGFVMSITISVVACRAACDCCRFDPEQVFVVGNQIPVACGGLRTSSNEPLPLQNNYEAVNFPNEPEKEITGTGFQQHNLPPEYTAILP